jgi:signal transduction histidine kinase
MTKVMSRIYYGVLLFVSGGMKERLMRKRKIDTHSLAIPSLGKTIRYIEWIAIATSAIVILLRMTGFVDKQPQPPILLPDWLILICLLSLVPLSFIFPIDRPLWQRRAYILFEVAIILFTRFSNVNLELSLYLIYAKACFLLKRKDVITIVIVAGVMWSSIPAWLLLRFPELIKFFNSQRTSPVDVNSLVLENLVNRLSDYLAASTFVLLLSFVIVSERRSRQKAIELAKEIDYLSAALERSRIARDIHDSLGHTLTTLDIQLELAQKLFDRDRNKAKSALDNAKNLADRSLGDVRRSVREMRSDFNLDEALTNLISQIEDDRNLAIELDWNLPKLPLQTSYQIYYILQEGLTNIQKHAKATLVSIRGQPSSEGIILEIEDNGYGFNPNLIHSGYGLLGMKERVDNLGGDFKINSAIDRGTCIQIKIPT